MLQHYSANSWSKSEKPVCDALRPAICATIRRLAHSVPRAENQKKGLNQIWMRNKGFSASFSFSALWANFIIKFSNSWLSYWEPISLYSPGTGLQEEMEFSQPEWDKGVSVPGAFKLDHLQPFKPILFWNFSNFFTFILGSQFLLPQRANNGKGKCCMCLVMKWKFTFQK